MKVAILGGTGAFGRALAERLQGLGEDVALLKLGRAGDERAQVVVLPDLRQALDRDDAELAQGRPVMRRPACAW